MTYQEGPTALADWPTKYSEAVDERRLHDCARVPAPPARPYKGTGAGPIDGRIGRAQRVTGDLPGIPGTGPPGI
jgi:hypothetical protein